MKVYDIYSKRKKKIAGDLPDVYTYDSLDQSFRVQIVHIWKDAFGTPAPGCVDQGEQIYAAIHSILAREYGVFKLANGDSARERMFSFILQCDETDKALDVIELSLRLIEGKCNEGSYRSYMNLNISPDEAVEEVNTRFREHGIGYQYENKHIIRKDSEVLHSQVVKPTLALLRDSRFAGAEEEFLKAHEHYRHGNFKECLNDALKAFESTMKSICSIRNWPFNSKDTAKTLIHVCFDNGLLHPSLLAQLGALQSVLESGIPTLRNKFGGHGQGATPISVPKHLASYMLHLTATTILFLVEANATLE